jgi:murein DD-endopeptidase MepM/ murein hydrolase activator NlpD
MGSLLLSNGIGRLPKFRELFRAKDLFVHDGNAMRRVHISSRAQFVAASVSAFLFALSAFGLTQFVVGIPAISGAITEFASRQAEVAMMESRVDALRSEVSDIRTSAKQHAAKLEARQAFLAAMLKGDGDPARLGAMIHVDTKSVDAEIAAAFGSVEHDQMAMAKAVRASTEARYRQTARMVARLGLSLQRLSARSLAGVGGPYEPVAPGTQIAPVKPGQADPQFRALFNSWKRLDQLQAGIVAIPSMRPVQSLTFTSNFGIRTDPFRGGAAMHAGVDIPGAHATPIFATADAVVGRTGWVGGYGNLVELEHGRGIQTRYGHLSSLLVTPGMRVKRGQLIALMGSTGRSTGTHLHYEVRIDGRAVNPVPFLQSSDYLVAMQRRNGTSKVAVGGPLDTSAK